MVGDSDFEMQQDLGEENHGPDCIERMYRGAGIAPQHTKTESLVIAAEDFIADVDSLLVKMGGEFALRLSQYEAVNDSMGRLQRAVEVVKGESDGS